MGLYENCVMDDVIVTILTISHSKQFLYSLERNAIVFGHTKGTLSEM
jgi:hypothetical protein